MKNDNDKNTGILTNDLINSIYETNADSLSIKDNDIIVSIIIPTYNRENTILRAVNSVINQTYTNWELIIIDDGSTDNTKEIIKPCLIDKRIIYYYQKNKGVCAARNYGISKASGEYIALLDSDDEFLERKLELQLKEMLDTNIDFSLSNCFKVFDGQNTKIINVQCSFFPTKNEFLCGKIPLSASLMVFKKKISYEFLFDEDLPATNDFDFLLRVLTKYKCIFIKNHVVKIHRTLNYNRISTNYKIKIDSFKKVIKKIDDNEYNLLDKEKQIVLETFFFNIGLFSLLENDFSEGKYYLKCPIRFLNISLWAKRGIIYCLSQSPFLFNLVVKYSKFFWRYGLIKV